MRSEIMRINNNRRDSMLLYLMSLVSTGAAAALSLMGSTHNPGKLIDIYFLISSNNCF